MTSPRAVPMIETLEATRVADVMHVGLISCPAGTPLSDVAARMSEEAVHCILITPDPEADDGDWRVVSDLDLMGCAEQPDVPAGRIAASPVIAVSENDSVLRAVRLMQEYQTAHLLVLSSEGPSGVVSTFDVAGVMAGRARGRGDASRADPEERV